MFKFEILKKSKKSKARLGRIKTPHGEILTPAFIPVATLGVIKGGLDALEIQKTKSQCQIVNTFHFLDMKREDIVQKAGGLHKFTNFPKPIFTDSGGFQVFSLGKGAEYGLGKVGSIFPDERGLTQTGRGSTQKRKVKSITLSFSNSRELENKKLGGRDSLKFSKMRAGLVKKITEAGARFLSPRDGREIMLTPELSAEVQMKLGADFIYVLDICGSVVDNKKTTQDDLARTERWSKRFLRYLSRHKSAFSQRKSAMPEAFGIIQGGVFKDLRLASTEAVNNLPVFGIALGGALGKSRKEMLKIIGWINEKVDWSRPHHLLGIGDLESMPEIIKSGIDLFDCALPTRIARHGIAITKSGYLDIRKNGFKNKFQPIQETCQCFTCENYTLAQLNFLARAGELLAGKLLTIHNLFFLETYLGEIRSKVETNKI